MESSKMPMSMRESQKENEMKAFHQEVKTLLELEFNRIQNEFEAIEIWTGVLTVIFLIFSFYSLFKTEQLENQSKDELKRIKKISEDGETKLSTFDTNSSNALVALNKSVEEIKNESNQQITNLLKKEKTAALTDFDSRAKEMLETYKTQIEELMFKNQQWVEKACDLYVKKLQEMIEKGIDLEDQGEEELDDEEMNKDIENEEKEE